jgi:hypothetical protein
VGFDTDHLVDQVQGNKWQWYEYTLSTHTVCGLKGITIARLAESHYTQLHEK